MDLLDTQGILIRKTVSKCLETSCEYSGKVVITKRNRELMRGDFELRAPKLGKTWPSATTILIGKTLMEQKDNGVAKVHANGDLLLVHMDRVETYRNILTEVIHEGEKYGMSDSKKEKCCVYFNLDSSDDDITLDHLRSMLLSEHISNVLAVNGYEVCKLRRHHQANANLSRLHEIFQTLGISEEAENTKPDLSCADGDFVKLSECKWRYFDRKENTCDDQDIREGDEDATKPIDITLNLKQFIVDSDLVFDKEGYDKNINLLKLNAGDIRFKQAVDIAQFSKKLKISTLLHVDGHRKEVNSHQIDILSRIIASQPTNHAHVIHRGVALLRGQDTSAVSASDYYRYRAEEMHRAFSMKYGQPTEGSDWREIVEHVTQAAIKFDLLTTNSSSPVKLDMGAHVHTEEQTHTSGGVFVMYNCARLAMLLSQFHKHVQEGIYSPLPNVKEIDFSALREQEEWTLLFNYIATYPGVVRETMSAIETKVPRPQVHTHKICQFLLDLVKDFSSYYSRTHVLSEARPHLLPTMYARLTLLTALQHVIHNALRLLNIQPLSHM